MSVRLSTNVNGKPVSADVAPRTLLVDFLRDHMRLTGTHIGCDTAQCGACTIHVDGRPVRSCVIPASAAAGRQITTIEGISGAKASLHPVQQAWIDEQVPQCGYCQSGQVMAAAALLENNLSPTDTDIDTAMSGIVCRCGTYPRIRKGIRRAAATMAKAQAAENGDG